MVEDWLESVPTIPARLEDALDAVDPPIPPREVVIAAVPAATEDRNRLIHSVWQALPKAQRRFLDVWEECNFNVSAAIRKLGDYAPCRESVRRWKQQPDFAFIMKVRKTSNVLEALEKNEIVLAAVDIREKALEPKPILYQGNETGYEENQPDVALRANEQLAKIAGVLRHEDAPIQGQGPALIIQVIQRDASVIDVTPRGVTIDLPAPDGA